MEAFVFKVGRSASEIDSIVGRREEGIAKLLVQLEDRIDVWLRL